MNTKATTKAEAIANLSLACMRLQCREDFPRGRTGYIEHICSPHATKAVREDAYKMAVRGLEDTEEARTIRADIDAYYAVDEAKEAAAALGRMGGSSTSPAKRAASRTNGAKGGRPRETPVERALRRRCVEIGRALAAAELAARRHAARLSHTLPPVPREFPLDRAGVLDRLRAGVVCRDPWDAPIICELNDEERRQLVARRDPVGLVLAAAAAAWAAGV